MCASACLHTPHIAQLSDSARIRAKPQTYSSSGICQWDAMHTAKWDL